jgi:hypothetical protein
MLREKRYPKLAALLAAVLVLFLVLSSLAGCKPKTSDTTAETTTGETSSTTQADTTTTTSETAGTTSPSESIAEENANHMKAVESMIVDPANDPLATVGEEEKYDAIDFANRFFRPAYEPQLTLFASTWASRPASLPGSGSSSIAQSLYSNKPFAAVVSDEGNPVRWFACELTGTAASRASKIIWQVGLAPFSGGPGSGRNAPGLLLSGEIAAGSREFAIDFAQVSQAESSLRAPKTPTIVTAMSFPTIRPGLGFIDWAQPDHHLRTYYVRAFPADGSGMSIGDTGAGLPVLYGRAEARQNVSRGISFKFPLLSTRAQGKPTFNGEFPNNLVDMAERTLAVEYGHTYYIRPDGFSTSAQMLVLQVSLLDFPAALADWEDPDGLVYEERTDAGSDLFLRLQQTNETYALDFTTFAPADSQLPTDRYLRYFARYLTLTAGPYDGTLSVSGASKTVAFNYGHNQTKDIVFLPQVKLDANLPDITAVSYTPTHFESADWFYRYIVVRQPTYHDIVGAFGPDEPVSNMPVGTLLDFTPKPPDDDKSLWEEAWDAISDFFGSIGDFFAGMVNWVANAYNNLKADLISFVAQNIPLPGDLNDKLEEALTYLVDYGLASIGLPPSLPNFDQLCSLGTDYLATMAMEQAGIPANDLIMRGVGELAGGLSDGLESSTQSASPNPLNWDFIQNDPQFMYRPAYLLITLRNNSDKPTPKGWLNGTVSRVLNTQTELSDPEKMTMYAKFGGNCYYMLFKPVYGQEIPSLAPGQEIVVPVFLEEYVNLPYYTDGPVADRGDFKTLYWDFGRFEYNFSITYDLPDLATAAAEQNHTEDAIYSYESTTSSINFKIEPGTSWSR